MTNDFFHGVQGYIVKLQGRPITALRSSIVGAVITARQGPVNKPTLIFGNLAMAAAIFGADLGPGTGTAGMTFKGVFDQIGTLVLVNNVCDPSLHYEEAESEVVTLDPVNGKVKLAHPNLVDLVGYDPYTIANTVSAPVTLAADGKFTVPNGMTITGIKSAKGGTVIPAGAAAGQWAVTAGVLLVNSAAYFSKTVWVTYTATLVAGTDFTLDLVTGQIARLTTSSLLRRGAELTVTYTYVDPSKVDAVDVIGVAAGDNTEPTGIYALRAAPTMAGVLCKPKLLIAPEFSHEITVAQALNGAAAVLNAEAFVDAPNENYEGAIEYALNFASELDRVTVHYPLYYTAHPLDGSLRVTPASIYLAGSQARTDKEDGKGDPYVSLSNKPIKGILGLTKPIDHTVVNLGETAGESTQQWLNTHNVVTTIREDGWRAYGNQKANGEFLCVRRMADYVLEACVLGLVWAIDKAIAGPVLLDQILTVVRQFLRTLEHRGALIANPDPETDNDVWFPSELNTPDQTSLGRVFLNFRMNPPPPLQNLVITGQITNEFLAGLFAPADA